MQTQVNKVGLLREVGRVLRDEVTATQAEEPCGQALPGVDTEKLTAGSEGEIGEEAGKTGLTGHSDEKKLNLSVKESCFFLCEARGQLTPASLRLRKQHTRQGKGSTPRGHMVSTPGTRGSR